MRFFVQKLYRVQGSRSWNHGLIGELCPEHFQKRVVGILIFFVFFWKPLLRLALTAPAPHLWSSPSASRAASRDILRLPMIYAALLRVCGCMVCCWAAATARALASSLCSCAGPDLWLGYVSSQLSRAVSSLFSCQLSWSCAALGSPLLSARVAASLFWMGTIRLNGSVGTSVFKSLELVCRYARLP